MPINVKKIQENISLAEHTTFRIGGPARYFFEAQTVEELIETLKWAKENSVRYFILGGGSNLLVSDGGFDGLAIKVKSGKFKVKSQNDEIKVEVEAGVPLIKIILETVKLGYSGAEWGFGIPGTIGGAVCGNAHRLGQSISAVVESVEILDKNLEGKILSRDECEFIYGGSRFKKTREIILSANLFFKKKNLEKIDEVLEQAKCVVRAHAPFPSAGCVFKNYESVGPDDGLFKSHPELIGRMREGKLGVGFLIDQCGLKGRQVGGAKIWEGHANYIVNVGGAKASDVFSLIGVCKSLVREKYGLELKEEIMLVGF